jgi:5,10-methylene-tetrahydrofolate dehydrogenase/methenyl tetrahydrofolate cyclohydrolase
MRARARFYATAALTASINAVQILDGRATAKTIRAELSDAVRALQATHRVTPGLGVLLVGERRDSLTYVRMKRRAADEVGIYSVDKTLPATASEAEIMDAVATLNGDPSVHGILVQLPLPAHVDEARVLETIDPAKDADGFCYENVARLVLRGGPRPLATACTPAGCVELLQRYDIPLAGKRAVVLGRSNVVGAPVAALLQQCDATVTLCHSATEDVQGIVRDADVVVAAIGRPGYVRGAWLKPGCTVIDVGINAVDDASKKSGYRLVGDVCFEEALDVAGAITPVPGGVGPMTIAMLLSNVVNLTKASLNLATDYAPEYAMDTMRRPKTPLRSPRSRTETLDAGAARRAASEAMLVDD